jgi:pSer/pThr/pTyr-binding forkhead associated (FHA) protein
MSVTIPIDSAAEEVEIDLDELPPGVGMLVVTRGPNSGSRYALDDPLVTAGRHPDSVIFLDDITVSRRHAEVRHLEGGYQVADVGSLNGTYLNRERVESAMLADGDELQIGTFKLLFLAGRP